MTKKITPAWRARVRAHMKEAGMTQADLARRIGSTQASVARLLGGEARESTLAGRVEQAVGIMAAPDEGEIQDAISKLDDDEMRIVLDLIRRLTRKPRAN